MEDEQAGRTTSQHFAWNTPGSTLQCIICVYSKHSNMQVEHAGSTLPNCLNTLGALYQAV